jgi:hypothetical protein
VEIGFVLAHIGIAPHPMLAHASDIHRTATAIWAIEQLVRRYDWGLWFVHGFSSLRTLALGASSVNFGLA